MSNWGLLVKDKLGNTSLDPDSFTVRLVETVWLYAGMLGPTSVIDVPTSVNVLAGMFPAMTVHDNYYINGYPNWQTLVNGPWVPPAMPIVEVYNGFVRVRGQPIEGSSSHGYVVISIMSYI